MTDAEVSSLVSALSVKAGRFRLSNKVLEVLAPYLVITLELKTLDDVESLGSRPASLCAVIATYFGWGIASTGVHAARA